MSRVVTYLTWEDVMDLRTARVESRRLDEPVGIVECALLDILAAHGVDVEGLLSADVKAAATPYVITGGRTVHRRDCGNVTRAPRVEFIDWRPGDPAPPSTNVRHRVTGCLSCLHGVLPT